MYSIVSTIRDPDQSLSQHELLKREKEIGLLIGADCFFFYTQPEKGHTRGHVKGAFEFHGP